MLGNIKVYKTNVMDPSMAHDILNRVWLYIGSNPSFDLDDCYKVLLVETQNKPVDDIKNPWTRKSHKPSH